MKANRGLRAWSKYRIPAANGPTYLENIAEITDMFDTELGIHPELLDDHRCEWRYQYPWSITHSESATYVFVLSALVLSLTTHAIWDGGWRRYEKMTGLAYQEAKDVCYEMGKTKGCCYEECCFSLEVGRSLKVQHRDDLS